MKPCFRETLIEKTGELISCCFYLLVFTVGIPELYNPGIPEMRGCWLEFCSLKSALNIVRDNGSQGTLASEEVYVGFHYKHLVNPILAVPFYKLIHEYSLFIPGLTNIKPFSYQNTRYLDRIPCDNCRIVELFFCCISCKLIRLSDLNYFIKFASEC